MFSRQVWEISPVGEVEEEGEEAEEYSMIFSCFRVAFFLVCLSLSGREGRWVSI